MPPKSAKPLKDAVGTRLIVEEVKKFDSKYGTNYILKTATGDVFANAGVKKFIEKQETPFVVNVQEPESFVTDDGRNLTYYPVECM